jgi:hypothetical protein
MKLKNRARVTRTTLAEAEHAMHQTIDRINPTGPDPRIANLESVIAMQESVLASAVGVFEARQAELRAEESLLNAQSLQRKMMEGLHDNLYKAYTYAANTKHTLADAEAHQHSVQSSALQSQIDSMRAQLKELKSALGIVE